MADSPLWLRRRAGRHQHRIESADAISRLGSSHAVSIPSFSLRQEANYLSNHGKLLLWGGNKDERELESQVALHCTEVMLSNSPIGSNPHHLEV